MDEVNLIPSHSEDFIQLCWISSELSDFTRILRISLWLRHLRLSLQGVLLGFRTVDRRSETEQIYKPPLSNFKLAVRQSSLGEANHHS